MKKIINPEKTTIEVEIKKLYKDKGWKYSSIFECSICGEIFRDGIDEEKGEKYDKCLSKVISHIIEKHPEYTYSCNGCDIRFTTKKDFTQHKH